jgi:RNA polymerase sigma-70 factor (ECF subfamily)
MEQPLDENTLNQLVLEHLPPALRLAVRLTGSPDKAEEIVQEALVHVARTWRTFRGQAQFRTWLFRIVINVFRDQLRHRPWFDPLPAELCDERANNPSLQATHGELGRLIAARISALPPRQREVLVLTAYESFAPREVAVILGISEANVYSTLHIARQRLQKELAAYLAEN